MRKSLLLGPLVAVATLSACAGIGRVPPVALDAPAARTPEPGNYAAIVYSRQWVLTTEPGPYTNCGPVGVYVDANGAYQDAIRAVLRSTLARVTFVSTVLTPDQLKSQGFDAQIVVSQGAADANLVGTPVPGRSARSDVSLSITVAVRDQRGALAQKTVSGHGRGRGEGFDCRQIVAAIGDAAQTAIGAIARQSAAYVAGALSDRRVARAAPAEPEPPPPKPALTADKPKREAPRESVQDTLRDAIVGGAVAAQSEGSGEGAGEGSGETAQPSAATTVAAAVPEQASDAKAEADAVPADTDAATVDTGAAAAAPSATPGPQPTPTPKAAAAEPDPPAASPAAATPSDEAPRPEAVALAIPRAAPQAPPSQRPPDREPQGPISAEEAFARGAAAAAGRGVPKSDAEALKWYRIAAAKGYAPAENNLGFMYAEGRGVPRNDAEAVKWYKRAAARKYPPAQTSLGMMYAAGRGVRQSDFEALALYSSAANQGYGQAKANLAAMYGEGRGVERDAMTATFLLGSVRERPYTGSGVYVEPQTMPEYRGE